MQAQVFLTRRNSSSVIASAISYSNIKAIADGLHAAVGLRREDIFINLIEVKKENWSFGSREAQYAA
jgi:hypothetical protein